MTIPCERTRAIIETKSFLQELQDPKLTPRVPASVRKIPRRLLRHYPSYSDIELAHKALPHLYGPVPPFSRLVGGEQTVGVIEAAREQQAGLKQMTCEVCVYEQYEAPDGRIVLNGSCVRCGASRGS